MRIDNGWHGLIAADGWGSEVKFDRDHVNNDERITAGYGGKVLVLDSRVDNDWHGLITADGRHSEVKFERDHVGNWGVISAAWGGTVLFDCSSIYNARYATYHGRRLGL